jgi:hypothetical protein
VAREVGGGGTRKKGVLVDWHRGPPFEFPLDLFYGELSCLQEYFTLLDFFR